MGCEDVTVFAPLFLSGRVVGGAKDGCWHVPFSSCLWPVIVLTDDVVLSSRVTRPCHPR